MYLGNRCPFEQFVINSISKYFTLITKLVFIKFINYDITIIIDIYFVFKY